MNLMALARDINARIVSREQIWEVLNDDIPVGVIGCAAISTDVAAFHGICFTSSVHGTGIPLEAVSRILSQIFANGFKRIMAVYFLDNARVDKFLKKLGAADHGKRGTALRGGEKVKVKVVEISAVNFCENRILRVPKEVPGKPHPVGGSV